MEQKALKTFCDQINISTADVFVVMAHKAVRLIQVLIDQNYISHEIANKTIVSSHALDFDCSYLMCKKVAIIDDILISGTSITSTVHKLLDLGVLREDISIITLAVDNCYQSIQFDDAAGNSILHCNTYLDDSTCIELSYTISKIFSYYGISYDIDYPNYNVIEMNEKNKSLFFNQLLWETDIISNESQRKGNVESFVLLPKDSIRQLLWKQISVNLDDVVTLKIRAYVNNLANGKKDCYIVPMCLFDEISEEELNIIYDMLKPKTVDINLNKDCYISKMRYLQFYISHQLYLVFNEVTSLSKNTIPTHESVYFLLGLDIGKTVLCEFQSFKCNDEMPIYTAKPSAYNKEIPSDFYNSPIGHKFLAETNDLRKNKKQENGFDINHIMLTPFLWWYDTKEIPVRYELTKSHYHFIENYKEIKSKLERLNSGFSINCLEVILKDVLYSYESKHLISLFIDRAVDEGIIVPTIAHDKNRKIIYRAYRHGEDLPFCIQDECRLLYYIKEINKLIPNIQYNPKDNNVTEGIATISFEKMIVLFYQMGIEQGDIFNRFLGFNNIKLLRPFLSMHGTVEGFVDPKYILQNQIEEHFYSESLENGDKYITWLTKWLTKNGFIKIIEKKSTGKNNKTVYAINCQAINVYLKKNNRNCISPVIKDNISNIADMISTWYKTMAKTEGKDKFKEDAVALTSCVNPFVYASAIATEIHYFAKFWNNQVEESLTSADTANKFLDDLFYIANLDGKDKISNIGQALYSGQKKVEFYNTNKASKVIEKVSGILKIGGANIWRTLWDSTKNSQHDCSKPLKDYINQVVGFLYFYSACLDSLKSNSFWKYGNKPEHYEEYKDKYKTQCKMTTLLKNELFDRLDEICQIKNFKLKKDKFYKLVSETILDSEDAVKNIEHEVENGATNYTIRYKSSLVFEIKALNPSMNDDKIINVWNNFTEDVDKTQINIVKFSNSSCDSNFDRYGIFYGNISYKKNIDYSKSVEILTTIYKNLCNEFNGQAYEIKAILIPDTPPGRMFKHNVQRNIFLNTLEFERNIIDILKTNYIENDTKQQLIIAMTDHVDPKVTNIIKEIKWDDKKDHRYRSTKNIFPIVKVYYNYYVKPNVIETKDPAFSVVKVVCGARTGTGFFFKTENRIVCITCNHILLSINNSNAQAIYNYSDDMKFLLNPVKKITIVDENTLLSAQDEIAILEPDFQGRIPFDVDGFLSAKDIDCELAKYFSSNCICCGYPNGDQCWSDHFVLIGSSTKGYFQTKINKEDKNSVQNGYSGGIIIACKNPQSVLGIHEGRQRTVNGRMISGKIILDEIERYKKNG